MEVDIPRLIGQKELQIAHLQASLQETSAQFQAAMLVWALVEGLFMPLRESLLMKRAEARARLAVVPRWEPPIGAPATVLRD